MNDAHHLNTARKFCIEMMSRQLRQRLRHMKGDFDCSPPVAWISRRDTNSWNWWSDTCWGWITKSMPGVDSYTWSAVGTGWKYTWMNSYVNPQNRTSLHVRCENPSVEGSCWRCGGYGVGLCKVRVERHPQRGASGEWSNTRESRRWQLFCCIIRAEKLCKVAWRNCKRARMYARAIGNAVDFTLRYWNSLKNFNMKLWVGWANMSHPASLYFFLRFV